MTRGVLLIRGETYLTFETVAACYEVEVEWLLEVHAFGLLGSVEATTEGLALAVAALDRVACVLRVQRQTGVELAAVAVLLGAPDRE